MVNKKYFMKWYNKAQEVKKLKKGFIEPLLEAIID